MKEIIKQIVIGVIILVLAMTIFSYFFNPSVKYKVDSLAPDIKEKAISTMEKIPTQSKNNCKEWAKEMTPKYWLGSDNYEDQATMYWTDGSSLNYIEYGEIPLNSCLRTGAGDGENINYLYYNPTSHGSIDILGQCSSIIYSKKVISQSGDILGTNSFTINPILKKATETDTSYLAAFSREEKILMVEWKGFDDFVKQVFDSETFNLEIYESEFGGWKKETICVDDFSEESGTFICDTSNFKKTLYINITPAIFDNEIYEIVEYNITDCNLIN